MDSAQLLISKSSSPFTKLFGGNVLTKPITIVITVTLMLYGFFYFSDKV